MDLFQTLFGKIWEWLLGPFKDLRGFKELIYGKDGDTDLAYGIFTLDEINNIYVPGMNAFVAIAVTAILVGIVFAGMKIASSGINPSNRTYVIEFFKDLVIVALVFFNLSTLYHIIFGVNYTIVELFAGTDKELIDMKDELDTSKGVLGELIIQLALLGLAIWANFYYMMRRLTLLLLMIMGPLMIALYLIPQTKGITIGWLKELIGTVFVQAVHAALYWMIALMSASTSGIEGIILYIIFIPVAESLRALLGLGGQMNDRLSKSAAMFGGASIAGMYGAIKGAFGKDKKKDSDKGGEEKEGEGEEGEGSKGLLSNAGTDIGSTSRAERMLKSGEIMSKSGKAVFGMAGAIAGAPMGPIGAIVGSTIGAGVGGAVGGVAGRAGMAVAEGAGRRLAAGVKAGANKFKGIDNAESLADEKLANAIADDETTQWANQNKDSFMEDLKERFPDAHESSLNKLWDKEVALKRGEFLEKARNTVGQLKKTNGQHARASELVDSTVNNLTNDWAKTNKEQFMKDYDSSNPLPANATEADILKHNQNKEAAWQKAVEGKRQAISSIASKAADKLGNGISTDQSFINKEDFVNEVGNQVSTEIGKGARESVMAVKGATSSVKNASIYSGKSVDTQYLASQLAGVKTAEAKKQFINNAMDSGISKQEAIQQWEQVEEPKAYQNNLRQVAQSMPKHIPLDHVIIGNKALRVGGAVAGAVTSGFVASSGVKEIGQFVADTKLGQAAYGLATGFKEGAKFDFSQGVISGVTSGLSSGIKNASVTAVSNFKNHIASDVIGKQAGFKNAVAYGAGIIGGVKGYKAGAHFASAATTNISKKGFNPYNNAVNNQISEVADIAHMAETIVGPNGQAMLASGAVRMVTTAGQTVIQVRDKTGQIQTVSRIGSGDSSLQKGQTVYQDLTIQNGQLVPSSNAYIEDSGGGKITLNRNVNVNPNQLVGNRNTPNNPRVVQEVQSYNQLVDSGQYYLKDAMNEMSNIHMVVDRNRSYLVGSKDGKEYRISPYGPGDARLNTEEVIYRKCEVQNRKLITTTSHRGSLDSEATEYYNSIQPSDLVPQYPPNKRNLIRKQNEKFRNKSFTESIR